MKRAYEFKTKEHKKEDNCDITERVKRFCVSQLAVFMFNNPGFWRDAVPEKDSQRNYIRDI